MYQLQSITYQLACAKEYGDEATTVAELCKIQETSNFSDLLAYMKKEGKAYRPDEHDSYHL
jgi:hypothetical protein